LRSRDTFLYNNVNVTQKKNRKYFGKLFTLASFIKNKQVLIQFKLQNKSNGVIAAFLAGLSWNRWRSVFQLFKTDFEIRSYFRRNFINLYFSFINLIHLLIYTLFGQ
jgi:hypothetical protein